MKLEPGKPYIFIDPEDGKSLLLLTEDGTGFDRYIIKETVHPTATYEEIENAMSLLLIDIDEAHRLLEEDRGL
mgnify:CR=1 FL=1